MENSRVVLITGASSGIGLSIGQHLSSLQYQVVGTSRNPDKYPNHPFPLIAMDVLDNTAVKDGIAAVIAMYARIDVLINNAGMGMAGPLEEMDLKAVDSVMNTNLNGPIRVMQHALAVMHKQQSGTIINVASLAGDNGLPFRSIYAASKAALMRVSESLRLELRHTPIQCTVLSPGSIKTAIAENRYYAPLAENSIYYKQYKASLADMNTHINKGLPPICVAKKVEKLINNKKLKPHYSVGPFLEVLSPIIKFLLPQRAYENLIASFYNLN
jgi:NAD(P)-dependent dehydrogenase (short-subunit alcohol dehydrogenase family)